MNLHSSLRWLFFSVIIFNVHIATPIHSAIPLNYFRLYLPRIPKLCFQDQTPIHIKSPDAYTNVIRKWQEKLNAGAMKLFAAIESETGLNADELFALAHEDDVLRHYCACKKAEMDHLDTDALITQDRIEPEVLAFLQKNFSKYSNTKNITFYITDRINTLTAVHGCDAYGYHVFCHSYFFHKRYIHQYYRALMTKQSTYYIEKCSNGTDLRWISIPDFLQIGLIEVSAYIQNQKNLIGFILSNYSFNSTQNVSKQTLDLHLKLETFHSLLSAVFQSRNPLEQAVFLMKNNHKNPEEKLLWKAIVKDIASTYSSSSLKKMKAFAAEVRKSQLQGKN